MVTKVAVYLENPQIFAKLNMSETGFLYWNSTEAARP